ncbi:glycosyltransferase family 4 protein [Leeuwenhoekiella sp. LLG6367-2.1]|uniref:glycosyltransferase family 4 protein n=1 Tax=Leeuwenhoekiella sp. LLG6367-2.1 TaxID=3160833 RepID=UPI0038699FBE
MKKKIAFFSPIKFSKKLGATKNRIEFGDALSKLGWQTFYIGPKELGLTNVNLTKENYSLSLKSYLIENAYKFTVILYEYDSLPFDRNLFHSKTLFIARPALLKEHKKGIKIPMDFLATFKSFINSKILRRNKSTYSEKIAFKSLKNSDLIQVQNTKDKEILQKKFPQKKIIIIPNGIGDDRFDLFQNINPNYSTLSTTPTIAFVGTFDYRKGAFDFKYIVESISKAYPGAVFKLIGTKGLFQTKSQVLNYFPSKNRNNIKVVTEFDPLDLPQLLSDCQMGIFPSYWESFGFGALEMMCAGLPVVAYSSAGPCDFIIEDLLVSIGDKKKLVQKVLELLADKALLVQFSQESIEVSKNYRWIEVAKSAEKLYLNKL